MRTKSARRVRRRAPGNRRGVNRARRRAPILLVDLVVRAKQGAPPPSPAFIEQCLLLQWRGNVRQLFTDVESAAAAAARRGAEFIDPDPAYFPPEPPEPAPAAEPAAAARPAKKKKPLTEEDKTLLATIQKFVGDVEAAAKYLGIPQSTAYYRLKRIREREEA